MPLCAQCGKQTKSVAGSEKSKSCAKCRSVTYCSVDCQKADWEKHKTTCKPCLTYVLEKVTALHDSKQWRKLLKWDGYLDELLAVSTTDMQYKILVMFNQANSLGGNTTCDTAYASARIPLLRKLIRLDGKKKNFMGQGLSLCWLGQAFNMLDNEEEEMGCFIRAGELGDVHGLVPVKCVANLGIGRIFKEHKRYEEAKPLLRIALAAAESIDSDYMNAHAIMCQYELVNVLFATNAIDEMGPLVRRFPKLLKKSLGPVPKGFTHPQMMKHIQLAWFHEVCGRSEEAESEMFALLALIEKNKAYIHDWRPMFLGLLDEATQNLKVLDPETGKKSLVEAVENLIQTQRRKDARW
jgi:MYND finger